MWMGWLAVAFTHIQLWHTYRLGLSRPNTFWFELAWNVQAMFAAMVLMRAAFFIHRRGSAFWIKTLTRLGELSFAIYLFHPAVLLVYRLFRTNKNLPGDSPLYLPYIIGGSLCALFISWAFVQFCFRRLPFAWLFLGTSRLPFAKRNCRNSLTAVKLRRLTRICNTFQRPGPGWPGFLFVRVRE
ncbi:hypothetical protein HMSSN036_19980 [Paenibacillus macerans]|nr:hypothetical protein HMSSN036_19980 [Paenibacillus macerans]